MAIRRYEVVRVAEKDPEYGHCSTCKHYQRLVVCSNCSHGSRFCFAWKDYYKNNIEKFDK